MTGRRPPKASTRRTNQRQYPRTARLNQLLREILADALEQIDDDRLELVTITALEVEPDLRHALVFYDSLQGVEGDAEVLEALAEWRTRLQGAIGRQAHLKRTPELSFGPDPAVRQGAKVESLLAEVKPGTVEIPVDPDAYESLDLAGDDVANDPAAD
jgi:ribosome-binding factor A